jgi:hypothetical protein
MKHPSNLFIVKLAVFLANSLMGLRFFPLREKRKTIVSLVIKKEKRQLWLSLMAGLYVVRYA